MMRTHRRGLIFGAAAATAFAGLSRLAGAAQLPSDVEADRYACEVTGYGPLKTDPFGVFDLPEGFSYQVISQAGQPMSDGLVTPRNMDGMGCFALDADRVVLVRNHEMPVEDPDYGAFGISQVLAPKMAADRVYDRDQTGNLLTGGTTTMVYDIRRQTLESVHLSLAGTVKNCAGGITPWESWLSCEEVLLSPGPQTNLRGVTKSHGWVFEVPSAGRAPVDPRPITGLGRFRHEATCIDPRTGVVYLTEDDGDGYGLFYRFLPEDRRNLHAGGRLQALGFRDNQDYGDSRNWIETNWRAGDWKDVVWIDLDGTDNPDEALRARGHARGAAWFAAAKASTGPGTNSTSPARSAARTGWARSCATGRARWKGKPARRTNPAACSCSSSRPTRWC